MLAELGVIVWFINMLFREVTFKIYLFKKSYGWILIIPKPKILYQCIYFIDIIFVLVKSISLSLNIIKNLMLKEFLIGKIFIVLHAQPCRPIFQYYQL